jgi:hypothetical protein
MTVMIKSKILSREERKKKAGGGAGMEASGAVSRIKQPAIFLQAALNGDRIHPATPRTPAAIAKARARL